MPSRTKQVFYVMGFLFITIATVVTANALSGRESVDIREVAAELVFSFSKPYGSSSIPESKWDEVNSVYGITATGVTFTNPSRNLSSIIETLSHARENDMRLLVTIGTSDACRYFPDPGRSGGLLDVESALEPYEELKNALVDADEVDRWNSYVKDGTVWAFQVFDEPHDTIRCRPSVPADPVNGEFYGLPVDDGVDNLDDYEDLLREIGELFPKVRLGTTSPPEYLDLVPSADWCFAQYLYGRSYGSGIDTLEDYVDDRVRVAEEADLELVFSYNANASLVSDEDFFLGQKYMCDQRGIAYVTAWTWGYRSGFKGKSFSDRLDNVPTCGGKLCVNLAVKACK